MDQPNNSVSPASPNDKQDDDSLSQDQLPQEAPQEVSVALNQEETTPAVPDGAYVPSTPTANSEDAFGDVPTADQADVPSLTSEDQSSRASSAEPEADPQSFSPTPAAPISPDASQTIPNQSPDFNSQPVAQSGVEADPPGAATTGQVSTPDASQFDPNAAAPQSAAPVPAHTDMKSTLILGAVAAVLIGVVAFFMFIK